MVKKNRGDRLVKLDSVAGDQIPENSFDDSILNPYINMHTSKNNHEVSDLLSQQFIQMNGMAGYYLPKEFGDIDRLYGEELEAQFNKAYQFAFKLESYVGFGGMGSSIGYGGLTVDDEMKIMINPTLFQKQCGGRMPEIGDWVYIKVDNSLFEVRYVDPYNKFYQFGKMTTMFVVLSKVSYNQEEIDPEVENKFEFNLFDYDEDDMTALTNLGGRLDTHINEFETNDYIKDRAEDIINYDEPIQGSGYKPKRGENRVEVESLDELKDMLGGRKRR